MAEIDLTNTLRCVYEGRHPIIYPSKRSLDSWDWGEFSSLELWSLSIACAIHHFALLTVSSQRKTNDSVAGYLSFDSCFFKNLFENQENWQHYSTNEFGTLWIQIFNVIRFLSLSQCIPRSQSFFFDRLKSAQCTFMNHINGFQIQASFRTWKRYGMTPWLSSLSIVCTLFHLFIKCRILLTSSILSFV